MDDIENRLMEKVDSIADDLRSLAIRIHDNPELSLEEYEACRLHTEMLIEHGFDVEIGVAGYDTSFIASHKSEKDGPVVAFLAEYDALPGLGHGCGHNLVGTIATGSAISVMDVIDRFGGEVRVYGTPAEETVGSKVDFIREGLFDDCDIIMMAHPSYHNADGMNTIAMMNMKVEFFGKAAHAAAVPEEGINALDAMISLYNMINAYRQQTRPDVRIHGIITNGGDAPNIIPAYTSAVFYIRANDREHCNEVYERMKGIVAAAAMGTGCKHKISQVENFLDDTMTNYALADIITNRLESFGVDVKRTKGEHLSVSSDLGNVSHIKPSVQMLFSIGTPDSGNMTEAHSIGFARDSCSDFALDSMLTYIRAFTLATYDILREPKLLTEIKEEFKRNSSS